MNSTISTEGGSVSAHIPILSGNADRSRRVSCCRLSIKCSFVSQSTRTNPAIADVMLGVASTKTVGCAEGLLGKLLGGVVGNIVGHTDVGRTDGDKLGLMLGHRPVVSC